MAGGTVGWIVLIAMGLYATFHVWFGGAYWLCGTDTTYAAFGEDACDALVEPMVPWAAIAATPLLILVVGGRIALRRQDRRLFAVSLIVPTVLLLLAPAIFDIVAPT